MEGTNLERMASMDSPHDALEETTHKTLNLDDASVSRLHAFLSNPLWQAELQKLVDQGIIMAPKDGIPREPPSEATKRGTPMRDIEHPKELPIQGDDTTPHGTTLKRVIYESDSSHSSREDVAPRRRREKRSPSPSRRKRPLSQSPPCHRRRKENEGRNKKRQPSSSPSPSFSSSSSSEESRFPSPKPTKRRHRRAHLTKRRAHKLKRFKEGGKSISFLTYDGAYGATDKVLAFVQQFDAAFGDEGFTESSKVRNVSMHFQKVAR